MVTVVVSVLLVAVLAVIVVVQAVLFMAATQDDSDDAATSAAVAGSSAPVHMLRVLSQDIVAVAQVCAQAPAGSVWSCFGSFGRDAATDANNDPATTIGYCNHATTVDHNAACNRGAVQNGFWEKPGGPRAVQYCALLDSIPESHLASRDACYDTIITRARDVFDAEQEYEQFCGSLPEERRAACRQTLDL